MSSRLALEALVVVAVGWWMPQPAVARPLSQAQIGVFDREIGPAFQQNNTAALLKSVTVLIAQLDAEGIEQAEKVLSGKKWPSLGQLLLGARMGNVQQGGTFLAPRPSPQEVALLLPFIHEQLKEAMDQTRSLPAMADPTPKAEKLSGYDEWLWTLKQADGTLGTALFTAEQSVLLKKRASRLRRDSLTEGQRAALDSDYEEMSGELVDLRRRLAERGIQLHLERLAAAVELLEKSTDLKQRFSAAYYLDVDGTLLLKVFSEPKNVKQQEETPRFLNADLNDPKLPQTVQRQVARGRELAGDLIAKSRLLHGGLWWWMRGRYGYGPCFFGLVKSEAALKSPKALVAVGMPMGIPEPTDPSSLAASPVPDCDRRHHYIWSWEERVVELRQTVIRAEIGGASGVTGLGMGKTLRIDTTRSFGRYIVPEMPGVRRLILPGGQTHPAIGARGGVYRPAFGAGFTDLEDAIFDEEVTLTQKYVPAQRADIAKRIVGFVEYAKALERLDELVRTCSAEELKAADELVRERSELTVHTNLSRKLQKGPSSLAETPAARNDNFQRRGLAWVMGLARVELAAMLAGFTDQKEPFASVLKTPFGVDEYREYVQDGMRSHVWSLRQDPDLEPILSGKASANRLIDYGNIAKPILAVVDQSLNRLLAYFRRVYVAGEFVKAAQRLGQGGYPAVQEAELKRSKEELESVLVNLFAAIQSESSVNVGNVKRQLWTHDLLPEWKAFYEQRITETLKRRGVDPNTVPRSR